MYTSDDIEKYFKWRIQDKLNRQALEDKGDKHSNYWRSSEDSISASTLKLERNIMRKLFEVGYKFNYIARMPSFPERFDRMEGGRTSASDGQSGVQGTCGSTTTVSDTSSCPHGVLRFQCRWGLLRLLRRAVLEDERWTVPGLVIPSVGFARTTVPGEEEVPAGDRAGTRPDPCSRCGVCATEVYQHVQDECYSL